MKGAKDVGLGEKSKPKFKRNPHKAKVKWKKGKGGEAKGKAGRQAAPGKRKAEQEPKAEQDGESRAVRVGEKRKDGSKKQHGAKRPKGVQRYSWQFEMLPLAHLITALLY